MQQRRHLVFLLSLGLPGAGTPALTAGPLQQWASGAAGTIGATTTRVPLGAAGSLSVYTESPPQTNGATSYRQNGVATPIPFAGPETVDRWWPAADLTFNPVQQSGNFAKPPGTLASLTSSSNGWNRILGPTSSFAEAFLAAPRAPGKAEAVLTVSTSVSGNKWAYAQAKDPWDFTGGAADLAMAIGIEDLYAYGDGSFAGLTFFLGSTIAGLEEIFWLNVEVSDGDAPQVRFRSNPAANLGLTDSAIRSFVMANLAADSGDVWSLRDPLQLTLLLSSPSSFAVSFSGQGYAFADPVPEPGTPLLMITGLLLAGVRSRTHKPSR